METKPFEVTRVLQRAWGYQISFMAPKRGGFTVASVTISTKAGLKAGDILPEKYQNQHSRADHPLKDSMLESPTA